jgi:hypothetical protein
MSTFHPFSRLPAELRLKVWGHAIPAPAIIKLKAYWKDDGDKLPRFSSISPRNGMLEACTESRLEYLKIVSEVIQPAGMERKIRHHPDDTVLLWEDDSNYIRTRSLGRTVHSQHTSLLTTLQSIKHLALFNWDCWAPHTRRWRRAYTFHNFGSLETITLLSTSRYDSMMMLEATSSLIMKMSDHTERSNGSSNWQVEELTKILKQHNEKMVPRAEVPTVRSAQLYFEDYSFWGIG